MMRKMFLTALVIAVFAVSMTICVTAQPPGYSTPPSPDSSQYSSNQQGYSGQGSSQYPSYPSDQQGNYPSNQGNYPPGQGTQNVQSNQNNQGTGSGQGANADHPTTGPQSQEPQNTPSASTGKVAENYGQGQSLTKEQVTQLGGETTSAKSGGKYQAYLVVTGLEQWALYNGQWTKDPAAVYYNGKMNLLVYNDQSQYLWSYEKYPNGYEDWHNWGYLYSGYYNRIFIGDSPGWHQIAVWGSQSGWSNVLWIYVYGP